MVRFVKQNHSVHCDQKLEVSRLLVMLFCVLCGQIFTGSFSTEEEENWLMEKNLVVGFKPHCKIA